MCEKSEQICEGQEVSCPWCHEADFDLIGLKGHLLNGHCEAFDCCERPKTTLEYIAEASNGGGDA